LIPGAVVTDRNFARTNNGRIFGRALMDVVTNGTEYTTALPGYAYLDLNHNGVRDSIDIVTTISSAGDFMLGAPAGNYVLRIESRATGSMTFITASRGYYRVTLTGTEALGAYLFLV